MNEIMKEKLEHLNEDEAMLKAIKYIFNKCIDEEKPKIGVGNNTLIGEKYRAYSKAIEILTKAFTDIGSYRNIKVGSDNTNRGK